MKSFALLFALTVSTVLRARAGLGPSNIPMVESSLSDTRDDPAQAGPELSRAIAGSVLDPSGAGIPGADVTLTRTNGSTTVQATTDNSGAFHFEKLALGTYVVHVQVAGFREAELSVNLGRKPVTSLRINLAIASRSETVTVGAQDASARITTDVGENQNANTIDRSALDRVPVFDQDYITTLSRFLDDNAIGTNGVTLVVNGVEANGPGVTPSAIQEVKINQNPYSALYSRPGRARLEIVTKGGTPDFH
jgi:hypothetical protein